MPEPFAPFGNAGGTGGHDAVTSDTPPPFRRPVFVFLTEPEPIPPADQRTAIVWLGDNRAHVTYSLPEVRRLRIAAKSAGFATQVLAGPSVFVRVVCSWDLTLNGEPIPLTIGALAGMPPGVLETVAEAIVNDRGPELEATG